MLQVGVHHRDVKRGARQDSFDAGGSEPAAANPPNATYSAVVISESADCLGGSIMRVIVDENYFPVDPFQRATQRIIDGADVVVFIAGWHDDGELRPWRGCGRALLNCRSVDRFEIAGSGK